MSSPSPRTSAGRAAVFLDRDGTLNRLVVRDESLASPRLMSEFELFPDALDAVRLFREFGLLVFVVTNQPDVARRLLAESELRRMSARLSDVLAPDAILVCTHDDRDACDCRKPAPGMLVHLADRWNVDLTRSFMIGDSWRDMEAGRRAGCMTIFVRREEPNKNAAHHPISSDVTVPTLLDAAHYIAAHRTQDR